MGGGEGKVEGREEVGERVRVSVCVCPPGVLCLENLLWNPRGSSSGEILREAPQTRGDSCNDAEIESRGGGRSSMMFRFMFGEGWVGSQVGGALERGK